MIGASERQRREAGVARKRQWIRGRAVPAIHPLAITEPQSSAGRRRDREHQHVGSRAEVLAHDASISQAPESFGRANPQRALLVVEERTYLRRCRTDVDRPPSSRGGHQLDEPSGRASQHTIRAPRQNGQHEADILERRQRALRQSMQADRRAHPHVAVAVFHDRQHGVARQPRAQRRAFDRGFLVRRTNAPQAVSESADPEHILPVVYQTVASRFERM